MPNLLLDELARKTRAWLRPSIQTPRYIALLVKAVFKPSMDTQEAIKEYWDTWNKVYKP